MEARRIIPIEVKDEYIIGAGRVIGAKGSHDDVALRAAFNDMWDGTSKTAVWLNALGEQAVVQLLLPSSIEGGAYLIPIPEEAKSEVGDAMLTIKGFTSSDGATEESATITATAYFRVLEGDFDQGASDSGSITLNQSEQFQTQLEAMKEDIVEAAKAADAAERAERAAESAQENMETAEQAAMDAKNYRSEAEAAADRAEDWGYEAEGCAQSADECAMTASASARRAEAAADGAARNAADAAESLQKAEGFSMNAKRAADAASDARAAAEREARRAETSVQRAEDFSSDAKDFSEAANDSANAAAAAAQRAEAAANEAATSLDNKLDKTGGTMTGDLNVYSADVNVTNGNVSVENPFWWWTAVNAGNIKMSTDEGTVTLSPAGLVFEDVLGQKKNISGVGYAVEKDQAVPFGQMEKYVAEAVLSITTNETLTYKDGVLSVNTADAVGDNTLPITAAAVNTTVGNIEILLKTI